MSVARSANSKKTAKHASQTVATDISITKSRSVSAAFCREDHLSAGGLTSVLETS